MGSETPPEIVRAFREMFVSDVRGGGARGLDAYLAQFPGHDAAIEAAYRALAESVDDESRTVDGPVEEASSTPHDGIAERIGPFRIGRQLGTGGMGAVYLAEPVENVAGLAAGSPVALKVVHPHLVENTRFLKRFRREAELGCRVRHVNVARTLDVGVDTNAAKPLHYIAMEYVAGQSLREVKETRDRLPETTCRDIARGLCRALAAVHAEGIVHRDVKPENVLLTPEGVVKLMDLGVAKAADATTLTEAGQFVGSVQYAAPEQFKGGGKDIDGRADLHALGLVLYELATGEHPFGHDDFRKVFAGLLREIPRPAAELNPAISPFFEELLQTLLEKDRNDRFESADVALRVLDEGEDSEWWRARSRAIVQERAEPLRRLRVTRETAVLGRDAELRTLADAFDAASEGRGRVLVLEGQAGIGKTRLVDEAVRRLEEDGTSVAFLFGSYPPIAASASRGAFATAFVEHFGRDDLDVALPRYLSRAPALVPAFAAFLRDEAPPEGVQPLDPHALQAAFVHIVQALAAVRPLVLLIDDLHFAPKEGRDLFAALAPAVAEHRVLLLGATRPGVHEEWVARTLAAEHASRLTLERLDDGFVGALLTEALHSESLAREIGDQIAERAAGNPFFVLEILRGLEEGRFLTRTAAGTWEQTGEIGRIRLPDSLAQVIRGRVHDLDEEDREVLEVAACCGFEFDPLLVGNVLGMKEIPLLRRLGRLERARRLVHALDRRYVFDHHQIQEALYEGMSELLRERYHAAIADDLVERSGTDATGLAAVEVCEHALAGARGDTARAFLTRALDHLEARFAQEHLLSLSSAALATSGLLDGVERIDVLKRRAVPHALRGRLPDARVELEEAGAIAAALGDTRRMADVRYLLAQNLSSAGRFSDATNELERTLELVESVDHAALRPTVLRLLGGCLHRMGRKDEALAVYDRAIESGARVGSLAENAATLSVKANLLSLLGRHDEAVETARESMRLAVEAGNPRLEGHGAAALGIALRELGRHDEVLESAERHLGLARRAGDRRGEFLALGNIAVNQRDTGRYGVARRTFETAWRLAREMGMGDAEGSNLVNLGQLHAALGQFETARSYLDAALTKARELGFPGLESYTTMALGKLAHWRGDDDVAFALLTEACDGFRGESSWQYLTEALVARGALSRDRGRGAEAAEDLREVLATSAAAPTERVLAAAYLTLLTGGDPADAVALAAEFDGRLRFIEDMEVRHLLWEATADASHIAEAKRMLGELAEHAPPEAAATLHDVPLHRAIRDA